MFFVHHNICERWNDIDCTRDLVEGGVRVCSDYIFAIFIFACGIVVFQNYKQFWVFTNLVNFNVLYMVF